jgi:hypothetical protein
MKRTKQIAESSGEERQVLMLEAFFFVLQQPSARGDRSAKLLGRWSRRNDELDFLVQSSVIHNCFFPLLPQVASYMTFVLKIGEELVKLLAFSDFIHAHCLLSPVTRRLHVIFILDSRKVSREESRETCNYVMTCAVVVDKARQGENVLQAREQE